MHSEAQQTETWKSGAETGLLQGCAQRPVALDLKICKLSKGFQESLYYSLMREWVSQGLG